jgi:hypothetical protein
MEAHGHVSGEEDLSDEWLMKIWSFEIKKSSFKPDGTGEI